jgi:hypothetical protein
MTRHDELDRLLAPANRASGDPLAEVLGRLADLPARRAPVPSARLAAFLDDGERPAEGPALLPPVSVTAPPWWRARRVRPRTAAGWAMRLAVGTGGLLLVGTAAMAAIGHSDGGRQPSRDVPAVNQPAVPGAEPQPARRKPSAGPTLPSGGSTAGSAAGSPDRPPLAPPRLLPPPAGGDSSGSGDGHGDSGGATAPRDGSRDGGHASGSGDGSGGQPTGDGGGPGDGGGTTGGDGGATEPPPTEPPHTDPPPTEPPHTEPPPTEPPTGGSHT